MNRKLYIAACILCLISCSKTDVVLTGYGYLTAAVTRDNSTIDVTTKADDNTDSEITFKLDVFNGTGLVQTIADHKTLSSNPLQLKTDKYTVKASNRDEVAAIFDSPRYAGETTIEIKPNTTVNASIKCSLADVLVAPTFTEDFTTKLKSYKLVVSNGLEGGSLAWTSADAGKVGYFKVSDKLDWVLTITNNANKSFDIKGSYTSVKAKQKYAMSFKLAEDVKGDTGAGNFKVVLDDSVNDKSFDYSLDFTTAEAEMKTANVWALFADLKGEYKVDNAPAGLGFEYCKTGSDNWTSFDGEVTVDEANKTFSARVTGLDPNTKYSFRAKSSKESGKRLYNVETEIAGTVPYMDFDDWYMDGKAPMLGVKDATQIWDTANPGSARFDIIPTHQETEHVAVNGDNKSAAKLETVFQKALGYIDVLAAGNIYTGKFGSAIVSVTNPGARLSWGTPFSSRPLALKGYYDYQPKTIDYSKGESHKYLIGEADICQIQIFLTDWEGQFKIDTQAGTFVDVENDPNIIAYGKLESNVNTRTKGNLVNGNGYEPFTIKLDYRDLTRKPTMIVIVAAASKYGDYFTGGIGSTLYLDEFSFVYDPSELEAE